MLFALFLKKTEAASVSAHKPLKEHGQNMFLRKLSELAI
jgi:hypothetical protein